MHYEDLSPESRVWIYQCDRELTNAEVVELQKLLAQFAQDWVAHGRDLIAHGDVYHNRFIVLFADETRNPASGCSIDASVTFLKQLEQEFGLSLFDRMHIAFMLDGGIRLLHHDEIAGRIASGELNEHSLVFNNLVRTREEFDRAWLVPLRTTWLAKYLKQHVASS